jgi:iron(III) transport system substrate-binding protein
MTASLALRAAFAASILALAPAAVSAAEVNLYTTREPGLIQPLLDRYTAETGTTINTIFVKE